MQFGLNLGKLPWFYLILGIFLAIQLIVYRVARSRLGYQLVAIRESQEAAESLGVPSPHSKLKAMFISAFLTGVLGTFYANYFYFIDPPTVFSSTLSIQIAAIGIIGGVSTLWGPLIGAIFLIPISLYSNVLLGGTYSGVSLIVYGVMIVLSIRLFPFGFVGYVSRAYKKLLSLFEKR
jgi:branched-chain amino acid transport system permease protein